MSVMNTWTKSLNCSRIRFNRTATLSTFSEQQRFQCFSVIKSNLIAKKSLEILIPFVTQYLCQQSFSMMVIIKTKKRNRLCCENYIRVALAKVKSRISEIVSKRQQQKSHWFAVNIHYDFVFVWNSCFVGFVLWTVILCANDAWYSLCTNTVYSYICFEFEE